MQLKAAMKMKRPYNPDEFAGVKLFDQFGNHVALTRDADAEGVACLDIVDPDEDKAVSAWFNRSQVVLLRTALDLWLEHLDGQADDEDDDDED